MFSFSFQTDRRTDGQSGLHYSTPNAKEKLFFIWNFFSWFFMCSWFILLHFFLPLCLTTTSLCSLARDCIKNALKIRFFVHRVPDYVSKRETNWKPERCFVRSGKMILSVCTYVCVIKLRVHYALIITMWSLMPEQAVERKSWTWCACAPVSYRRRLLLQVIFLAH